MAVTAPVCNTTVFAPDPGPHSPGGFRMIPANATLEQAIRIINDNFSAKKQTDEFNRQLAKDLAKPSPSKTGGLPQTTGFSTIRRAAQKEVSMLKFHEVAIVRKKIKVYNPEDKQQYVIDDRVKALVMTDDRTGATWTYADAEAGKGVSAGNEQTTISAPGATISDD